jgi:DNA polymerase III subunit delta
VPTPAQFLARVKRSGAPPVALLLGPEAYERRRIKEALLALYPEDAVARHDLADISLAEALDDARSLSLFAAERLIWVSNAEAALPRTSGAAADSDEPAEGAGDAKPLDHYLKDPTPGVAVVFEANRFDFEGDDKRKLDRVRKFYAAVPEVVELRKYSSLDARREAETLVACAGFPMAGDALDLLVDSLGADIARIAVEIEKLALFAGGRPVGVDDIAALVPDARAGNVFALVNALGRRDRTRALEILDALVREGEYLPLALAFLSTQFRTALAAREAGLKSASQIQSHFTRLGVPMWGSKADQVYQTMAKFAKPQLERALRVIYKADSGLRDTRPDDRIVMEQFILELVG